MYVTIKFIIPTGPSPVGDDVLILRLQSQQYYALDYDIT